MKILVRVGVSQMTHNKSGSSLSIMFGSTFFQDILINGYPALLLKSLSHDVLLQPHE